MIFVAASLSQKVALAAMLRNATSNSQKGCRRAEYQICIIAFGILVFLYIVFTFFVFVFFNFYMRRRAQPKFTREILSLKVSKLLQKNCAMT